MNTLAAVSAEAAAALRASRDIYFRASTRGSSDPAAMRAAQPLVVLSAAAADDYVRGCPGYVAKSFRMLG